MSFHKRIAFKALNDTALQVELWRDFFPKHTRSGDWIRAGDIYGSAGSSLAFNINGGYGKDHASGQSWNDMISYLALREHCSQIEAARMLQNMVGGGDIVLSHTPLAQEQHAEPKQKALSKSFEYAQKILRESIAAKESPVQSYLIIRRVPQKIVPSIRFHPSVWHSETRSNYPAMVSAIQSVDGKTLGIHVTYLALNTEIPPYHWEKASCKPAKKIFGSPAGGAVRLAPAGKVLAVAEGIETALSFNRLYKRPVWAALSTAGIIGLKIPGCVQELIIAADNDKNNAGQKAAQKLADRESIKGRIVKIITPQISGQDWNNAICSMSYKDLNHHLVLCVAPFVAPSTIGDLPL